MKSKLSIAGLRDFAMKLWYSARRITRSTAACHDLEIVHVKLEQPQSVCMSGVLRKVTRRDEW